MRKKISLVILSIMIISTMATIGARERWNPGDPYIPCYGYQNEYTYPTTTIPGGQSVSFDIPTNPCPPVIMIQIGGMAYDQQIDTDTTVIDQTPSYMYQCTPSTSNDCLCVGRIPHVEVCGVENNRFTVTTYDSQGGVIDTGSPDENPCIEVAALTFQDGTRSATRFVIQNNDEVPITVTSAYYTTCCYDCRKKEEPPATILYPKVDIEQFAVAGGATIIKDGKLLTNLELSPGTQQTFIQVENRGFFTQNDTRIRFEGLPDGVTVSITPETQKLKSQNLATYSATFTVGPNVPSGTYQVTLVSYSEKGMFDKITFEFVVP
jgi:hypothetical protein